MQPAGIAEYRKGHYNESLAHEPSGMPQQQTDGADIGIVRHVCELSQDTSYQLLDTSPLTPNDQCYSVATYVARAGLQMWLSWHR